MALKIREIPTKGYERVVEGIDEDVGLHCIIAVHNTTLGPALGGTRMYPYQNAGEALTDVLRLAEGMTYKSAVAEIGLGGGKSVIIGNPKTQKTEELLFSFGKVVDHLEGLYICAEDMGTKPEDMLSIRKATPYVVALPNPDSSGDPSPFTAWGTFRGIQAVAHEIWGTTSLKGLTVAVQGLGSVGEHLAQHLFWNEANLILSDVDEKRCDRIARKFGAPSVSPEEIIHVPCDIFAPCAIGGIINSETIPELRCKAVAGAANNQLLNHEDGKRLLDKHILYAPDYVINAGGIINVAIELEPLGYNPIVSRGKVDQIFSILTNVFDISKKRNIATSEAADELALHKLQYGIGKRKHAVPLGDLSRSHHVD